MTIATPPRRARRALSLGVYLTFLTIVSGVLLNRHVASALSERGMAVGRRLDAFQALSGPITEMSWNGEVLDVSTGLVDEPPERVLAQFVSLCDGMNGAVPRELGERLGSRAGAMRLLQRLLVMRDLSRDGTGAAVCFAGLGDDGLPGLLTRALRFTKTLDLGALGALRYAYLRKINDHRTQVILVSADQGLRLDRLVPRDGSDAPGDDLAGVRPARAVRLLTAYAKGTPHAISAYRSQLSPDGALIDMSTKLRAQGFVLRAAPRAASESRGSTPVRTEAYVQGAHAYVVTSQPDADEGGSLVSIVRLAAGHGTSTALQRLREGVRADPLTQNAAW